MNGEGGVRGLDNKITTKGLVEYMVRDFFASTKSKKLETFFATKNERLMVQNIYLWKKCLLLPSYLKWPNIIEVIDT